MLVEKLTPELLVTTPRRSPAIPNHDGSLALYSQTVHTIGGTTERKIRVLNIQTSNSWVVVDDDKAHDATWIEHDGRNAVLYLRNGDLGITWLMMKEIDRPDEPPVVLEPIPGDVSGMKLRRLQNGTIAVAVMGRTGTDGSMFNLELERPQSHRALVFDTHQVRNWDSYRGPSHYSVWYTTLVRDGDSWRFSGPMQDALRGTNLEVPYSPSPDQQSSKYYDLSERGIVIEARPLDSLDDNRQSAHSSIYYIPLYSYTSQHDLERLQLRVQSTDLGTCSEPTFNKDGTMIGFIHARSQTPEDREIFVKHVLEPSLSAISVSDMVTGGQEQWIASLVSFSFSPSGHFLYITARDCGRIGLFALNLQPNARPRSLLPAMYGSCHAVYPLGACDNERVLVSTSSLTESSLYQVILVDAPDIEPMPVSSLSRHGAGLGLSRNQVSELYFEGGAGGGSGRRVGSDYFCQAHIIKPRDFDAKKKTYPVAILLHDGPIGAWDNAWDHQWNAAVWAEQGYVVVLPNISGSTGFGVEFATAVRDSWGGRPFDDLVNLMEHLKQVPGVDTDNAVLAGAGYGGYMMNWVQGQPFGRKFKAIVSHAGIFDIPNYTLTCDHPSEAAPSTHFGSYLPPQVIPATIPGSFPSSSPPPYGEHNSQQQYNPEGLQRYNPARPDLISPSLSGPPEDHETWTTPMLITHGHLDYRVPITESIAAYRICQSRRPRRTQDQDLTRSSHDDVLMRRDSAHLSNSGSHSSSSPDNNNNNNNNNRSPYLHNSHTSNHTRHESLMFLPRRSATTAMSATPNLLQRRQQSHPQPPARSSSSSSSSSSHPRSRLVVFPNEAHTIEKPENLLEWYRQVFAWTNRWTGITARQAFREFTAPTTNFMTSDSTATASVPARVGVGVGVGVGAGTGDDNGGTGLGILSELDTLAATSRENPPGRAIARPMSLVGAMSTVML